MLRLFGTEQNNKVVLGLKPRKTQFELNLNVVGNDAKVRPITLTNLEVPTLDGKTAISNGNDTAFSQGNWNHNWLDCAFDRQVS